MKLRFLGTGWSHGVPMIGCTCRVCRERDPKNLRSRPSIYLETDEVAVVVDTSPDFRQQVLANGIERVDAVLFTHAHVDHIMGFDDVRRFTWTRSEPTPVYGKPSTLQQLRRMFDYIPSLPKERLAIPRVSFHEVTSAVQLGPLTVDWIRVPHGPNDCWGLEILCGGTRVVYVPDTGEFSDELVQRYEGADVMVLNALRTEPHPSHLTIESSINYLKRIGAKRSYLTHMGCSVDYHEVNPGLPDGMELAYDGLVLDL